MTIIITIVHNKVHTLVGFSEIWKLKHVIDKSSSTIFSSFANIYSISIVVNFTQCRQCSILTYSPCTPSRQIYNWWRGSNQHLKSKDRLPIKVFYFIKNNCSPQIHLMSVAFFLRTTANELVIVGNQSTVLRGAL